MGMRLARPCLIVLALSALVMAPASEAAKRSRCAARGSHTLRADLHARIYSVRERGGTAYYGCLYRGGRRRFLADDLDYYVDDIRLAGPFVTYLYSDMPGSAALGDELWRVDLRSGKRAMATSFGSASEGADSYTDLVLTRRGTVVWIRS